LEADPKATRVQLAAQTGLTADGVKYHLNKLKAAGRIRHVGPTKSGYWEVLDGTKDEGAGV
jgi:ATP-dependent DNA helicase RecG